MENPYIIGPLRDIHMNITIIIPFFNSNTHRFNNLCCVLDSIKQSNIPVILVEQHNGQSKLKEFLNETYDNVSYIEHITNSPQINKSLLVNKGVSNTTTEYIWEVDSDVILKWDQVITYLKDAPSVIKPFSYVVRLEEPETQWYISNRKLKIKKGEIKETVDKFGPLSFIIKKSIYIESSGMNEDFEGWSWEDIEFARRIENKNVVTEVERCPGIHLWHPPAISNEQNNIQILQNKNTIRKDLKTLTTFVDNDLSETRETISLNNELSIIIPVKIDTPDRFRNLSIILKYFKLYFKDYELIVVEQDEHPKVQELVESLDFTYIYRENKGCFHKTWNFNLGIAIAKNAYVLAYDCDALFKPYAIKNALHRLQGNHTKFIYPYNSYMVEIQKNVIHSTDFNLDFFSNLPYVNHTTTDILDSTKFKVLYGDIKYDCTGGAFMFSRKDMLLLGGYNPNIISYGCEDNEIEVRVKKFGHTIERLQNFNCYHLEHGRTTDSHYNNFFDNNEREFQKIMNIDSKQLLDYVNNGFKNIFFDTKNTLTIVNDENEYSILIKREVDKIDLSEVDIVIPVYIDTVDRLHNIQTVIRFIEKHFVNYKIYLVELQSSNCKVVYHSKCVEYINLLEPYNKTKAINIGLSKCTRKVVGVWDVDAIIHPQGIKNAIESITNASYHIAYPYNGWFIDIEGETLKQLVNTLNVNKLKTYPCDNNNNDYKVRFSTRNQLSGGGNNGGCVFFNRETLNTLGNYNENFYEWGFEDDEIEVRFEIMGYARFNDPSSNCYHMFHSRSPEEEGKGKDYWTANYKEYCKVKNSTKEDLCKYIDSNFTEDIKGISLLFSEPKDDAFIKSLIDKDIIKDICISWDTSLTSNKIIDIRKENIKSQPINGFLKGQITIQDLINIDDIPIIIKKLHTHRRSIVEVNNRIYAYRTVHLNSVTTSNTKTFKFISMNTSKPKCSIILTTWGKETLRSKEWFDRFDNWKNSDIEIIVVLHDETLAHKLLMEHYKDSGLIDKLIYAPTKHGHIRGLALASKYVTSDILAVINNDVLVSEQCINDCIDIMSDQKIGLLGWHYDNIEHRATYWDVGNLNYTKRPNANETLEEKEIAKIKAAPWFSGKVFTALKGEKRLLLPNGSFIFTRTSLWNELGGFCFDQSDHFFHDDWYSYGVLEKGYNIANVPTSWGNSSKPEIFLSKTDYPWRGIEDTSKNIDNISINDDNIEHTLLLLACFNKKVCCLGDASKLQDIQYTQIKNINDKCDVIYVNEYITVPLYEYLDTNGIIIFNLQFLDHYTKTLDTNYRIMQRGNIGFIMRNEIRESYIKKHSVNIITTKNSKNKFIFLTQPRVGFNNMHFMLNRHPNIRLDLDIFKPKRTAITEVLDHCRISDPKKFLTSYWDLISMECNKKLLGFRFTTWDVPKEVPFNVIDSDYKVIMIKRDNIFEGMIDCAYAHAFGVWHTTSDITQFKPLTIDKDWASGWITGASSTYNAWKTYFDDMNRPYLEVSYETLYNDNKGLKNILDYLEVPNNIEFVPLYKKVNIKEIYNSITNKEDIRNLGHINE